MIPQKIIFRSIFFQKFLVAPISASDAVLKAKKMDCGEEDKATKAEGTRAGFGIVRQNQAKPTNKITRRCGSIQLMKACNCERTEAILLIQIASSALPPRNDKSPIRHYRIIE